MLPLLFTPAQAKTGPAALAACAATLEGVEHHDARAIVGCAALGPVGVDARRESGKAPLLEVGPALLQREGTNRTNFVAPVRGDLLEDDSSGGVFREPDAARVELENLMLRECLVVHDGAINDPLETVLLRALAGVGFMGEGVVIVGRANDDAPL